MNLTDVTYPGQPDPAAEPYELEPAAALGELREALGGWIAEVLEAADGYVHDPDRETAAQIMNSLYAAGTALARPKRFRDEATRDRLTRAGRQLGYAAEQMDGGIRVARANTDRPADEDDTELTGIAPGFVRTMYAAAVAYVRQASDLAYGGPRITARATLTRCCGGSFVRPCSHGREEDHVLADDGRCEGAQYLVDAGPCHGPAEAVIIRDHTLGMRHGDETDQRGVRACPAHGGVFLRTLDPSTRLVYPGPDHVAGYATDVWTWASKQDATNTETPKRVDR
jgi:hypothetical protein